MAKIIIFPILILFGLFSISAQAKIYKYVDEQGQVHYSSHKPTNKQYKNLQFKSEGTSKKNSKIKKIKILPTKDLDKAVREGKITETIANRMRHFNSVSKEYTLLKKKKKAMKMAVSSAKSSRSTVSAEQLKQLEKEYDVFVKEDFYYARRNYTVARKKLRILLDTHNKKKARSSNKKKKGASIKWN